MKVSPALLDNSLNAPMKAIDMVNVFSHSHAGAAALRARSGHLAVRRLARADEARAGEQPARSTCSTAASWPATATRAARRRWSKVQCPVLFVLGRNDAMTPPQGRAVAAGARRRDGRTVLVEAGHQMMTEAPDAVLFALQDFLRP